MNFYLLIPLLFLFCNQQTKRNEADLSYAESVAFIKSKYGIYTEELLGNEQKAKEIANLKISYVIYYYYGLADKQRVSLAKKDFNNFEKHGIKVLLMAGGNTTDVQLISSVCKLFKDVKNIIGWYCIDEPSFHKDLTIEKQDLIINAMKKIKNMPCYVADNCSFWPINVLSSNYDGIFLSTYAQTANNGKTVTTDYDILNAYGAIVQFSSIYDVNKLIPIYETFNYANTNKEMPYNELYQSCIAKKRFYGKNNGAFFIYSAALSHKNEFHTAESDKKIYDLITKIINFKPSTKPFLSFGYLYVPGHLFTSTYSKTTRDNAMKRLSSAKSTSTIGDYYKLESGIFIDKDRYIVIDFGAVVKSVRLDGYVSARSGYNRPLKFTLNKYVSSEDLNKKTTILKSVNVVTNSENGNARFTSILSNINSRYIILKGSLDNKNDIPFFQAIGYVAIPK